MACENFETLNRRTADDKVSRDKALFNTENPKYDRY